MWVKICGNTRLEDCQRAAEFGADAVGFVFAQGKRTVTAAQVAAITPHLPASVEKIGVFSTLDYDEIVAAVQQAGLTGVQLHTDAPSLLLIARLRDAFGPSTTQQLSIIQVTHRWTDLTEAEQGETFRSTVQSIVSDANLDALLVDSKTRDASGGTGRTFDWTAAKSMLTGLPMRLIVAGGLTPSNVADAVKVLQPWGVDTSSGVEDAPGMKNAKAMQQFIANARAASAK
jgi:phosphoribosylanthranilate isomerase